MDLSQLTPESWGFIGTVFITVAGGIGYLVRRWSETRVERESAVSKAEADAAKALADAWARLVDSAERREEAANKRAETAIASVGQLADVVTEQTTVNKAMVEEVKRANTNVEFLMRERR